MNHSQANIKGDEELSSKSRLAQLVLFIFFLDLLLLPYPGFTANTSAKSTIKEEIVKISESFAVLAKEEESGLETIVPVEAPQGEKKVAWSRRYTMTAYNSEVAQCDGSPCITANGFNVCEHGVEDTVAANFLKFGTEIRIPELFGDRIFTVRDRMNTRYTNRIDVWLLHKDNAVDFGVKYPLIEVLK